jgi:hypothetical protein
MHLFQGFVNDFDRFCDDLDDLLFAEWTLTKSIGSNILPAH